MAKKIDLSGMKEFLINHGEKVALGLCAFVALVLGVAGLWGAMGAGRAENSSNPFGKDMDAVAQTIIQRINSAQAEPLPEETAIKLDGKGPIWPELRSRFSQRPFAHFGETDSRKRNNPHALSIRTDEKYFDMQYVAGPVLVYRHDASKVTALKNAKSGAPAGEAGQPPPQVFGGAAAAPGKIEFLREVRPTRIILVTAVFPMKDQVVEFQKALRMLSQKDFQSNPADRPKPLGMNIVRYKFTLDGKPVNLQGERLVGYDVKNKALRSPKLENLLKDCFYDEDSPKSLEAYIWEGLHMPLPKLAFGQYPRFQFDGFGLIAWVESAPAMKVGEEGDNPGPAVGKNAQPQLPLAKVLPREEGGEPNDNQPAEVEREKYQISIKELSQSDSPLAYRLFGKAPNDFNVFHALGAFADAKPKQASAYQNVGNPETPANQTLRGKYFSAWNVKPAVGGVIDGGQPFEVPNVPQEVEVPNVGDGAVVNQFVKDWDRDAIIRFIDPEVEPGYMYRYGIQVVLANPNFGKNNVVAFQQLATVPVLVSKMEYTPARIVPPESFIYAVDQDLLDEWADPKTDTKKVATVDPRSIKDQTPFQIQKWVGSHYNPQARLTYPIGDWVIAERVMVRKGDRIGYPAVPVRVPIWDEMKDRFVVPRKLDDPKKKSGSKTAAKVPGFYMPLSKEEEAPVLVDYVGGKRLRPRRTEVEEESAVDALILTPDGKLSVLNSRIASDPEISAASDPSRRPAAERQERVLNARRRVAPYLIERSKKTGPKDGEGPPGVPLPGVIGS